jgi:hypothetical protein
MQVQLSAMSHPSDNSLRFMYIEFPMLKPTTFYGCFIKVDTYTLYLNFMFCC